MLRPEVLPPVDGEAEPPARRLSSDLRKILREANGRALTLGELETLLQGRGFALLIILLSLPSLFPIPIPGQSILFGIVVMLLGVRLAVGQKPSLPRMILRYEVKHSMLESMVNFGLKLCGYMEKVVRPRMPFLQRWPGMLKLIGIGIASGGLQLLLPLPPLIPFSNFIPALSVVLLTTGMSEGDGLLVLAGYVVNIAAWIYFSIVFAFAGEGGRWIIERCSDWLCWWS